MEIIFTEYDHFLGMRKKKKDKEQRTGSYLFTDITEIFCIKDWVALNATEPLKVMGCDLKPVSDAKTISSQGPKL